MDQARITAAWARRAASAVTCALVLFTIGCGGDHPGTDDHQSVQSALGGTTVSVDQVSYAAGAMITVSYAGLPGNADDWIAIAPAGAPNTSYVNYVFTQGQTSGTASMAAPAGGSYVARALPHNTFVLLAESPAFAVTDPTIATDRSSYEPGTIITVTYAGMPGYANDWIALAPAGSPNTTYRAYVFTNGQTSGTISFTAPVTGGSYVVRGFPRNTFTRLTETAPFTVGSPSVTPAISADQSSYAIGATITVSYSGLPGNVQDKIVLTTAGAANTSVLASVFTNGQTSGTATFATPTTAGSYVVRAFPNNSFELLVESAAFTVASGATVSVDKSSYAAGATITVSYSGLPGYADDWIALAPAGASSTTYVAYVFTNGQTSGTASLTAPAGGSYVARAFPHNTFALLAEGPAFTVTNPTVTTDQSSYAPGATITVTYAGMPGYANDWIALAPAGASNKTYLAYVFTNGQTSGTASFTAPATTGSYVARAFPRNTFALLAESAFAVTTPVTVTCPTVPALTEILPLEPMSNHAVALDIGDTHVLVDDANSAFFFDIATSTKTAISSINLRGMTSNATLAFGTSRNVRGIACELGTPCWELGSWSETLDSNGVDMVGIAYPDGGRRAFKSTKLGGEMVDLGTLGGDAAEAVAINGSGQIVGDASTVTGSQHAFLWDGTMHDLGALGGDFSGATAINASGQVVGYASTAAGQLHAFLWDGTMHDLGTLSGTSYAQAINASGQVVGYSELAGGGKRAFFWSAGVMTDLGTLGGAESQASWRHPLNDAGQVVGRSTDASGNYRAFVWQMGVMRDLGTLGSPTSQGVAINAAGTVVGTSGNFRSFIVAPGACTRH